VCSGTPSNLVAFSSIPSGANFNWNSLTSGVITGHTGTGNGSIPSMNLSNTTNHIDSIIYNVKPTLNGCTGDSIYFHYVVKPLPIITLPVNDTICSGAVAKVVHFSSNLNNTTYSYSAVASNASVSGYLPNGILDSIPSQILYNSAATQEQITYTIIPTTDGCIGLPVIYTITINPSPAVNFSIPNQTICSGTSSSLVNISSPSLGSNITWTCAIPTGITGTGLLTNGGSSIPSQILNDTLTTPVTLSFIVTASTTGNTLCAGAANTYTVTVNPIPIAYSSPLKDTICSGSNTNFLLSSNVSGTTFNWVGIAPASVSGTTNNSGNSISDNLVNSSVLEQIAGYTITPTFTHNSIGCNGTPIIANAWVNPSPIVSFSMADQDVCNFQNSQTVQLSSLTPNVSFNWTSNPNGVFGVTPSGTDSIGIQNLQKSGFVSTAITYSATATYRGCIGLPSIYTIKLRPLPFVNFNVNYLNCKGAVVQFINNSTGAQNHFWNFGDATAINNFASPSHVFNTTDTFIVNYIAESQYGCRDSLKDTLVVVDIPVTNFVLGNDSGCAPLNVSILNNTTGYNPTYSWVFNNGNTSNTSSFSPPNQFYNSAFSKDDTIYQVSLTASNICGSTTHLDTVKVIDIPKPLFGLSSHNACSPFSCQFLNVSTGSIQTYQWIFGDGTTSNVKNPAPHLYYANGADSVYYIQLIVTNSCGSDTLEDSIIIHPKNVAAFATATPGVGCTPLTVNFSAIAQGATSWHWDFGNGNSSSFINGTQVYTTGTYTAYFYSDNGCSYDTQAVVVTVNPLPFLTSSVLPPNACIGQNLTFTNTSAGLNYSLWDLGDGTTTLNNSITHSYPTSGVYHAFLVGTSQTTGCTDTLFRSITVNPLPVVAINPIQDTICLYATAISLSGLPSGGTFSGVGVSGSIGSFTFNPAVSSAGSFNFINYSYTNANGCTGTTKDSIMVINPTAINFTGLPASMCVNNQPASLTGIPAGGIFSGIGVVGNNFNPAISGAGTHTITYTYTNSNNCTNTVTHSVIVNALPVINISSTPNNICINAAPLNLSATPSGGLFYGSGISSNTFNPASVGVGGAYQFYYAYTDANGCSDTAVASINVLGLPGVNINPIIDTACVNSIAISLSGNPAGGTFSGIGVSGTVGNFTFNPSTPGAGGPYLITYTYTNASGCSNSSIDSISVINPTPVNIINLPSTICINSSAITLQGTPIGGSFSGLGVSGGKFNPTLAGVGNHTILYSYTDNHNCTNTNTANIQVNNTATISIQSIPSSVCLQSNSITLSATPVGGYFSGKGITSNQFDPITAGVGGPYTLYYVYANGNGCIDSSSINIIVRPNAIATVQLSPLSGCIPLPVSSINNSLNTTTHKWYWGDGDTSILPNPSHVYQYTNFYQAIYIANNTFGCSDTATFNVSTYSKPTANFSINNLFGCSSPFNLTPTNNSSGNNINQWTWDTNNSNLIQPSITFQDTGNHVIELIVTNNLGCKDTINQNFKLYPTPVAGFTIQPISGCEPLLAHFINNSIHGAYYDWIVNGTHYSNDRDTICWFNTAGNYNIQLDIMNYNKTCSSTYVMPNNYVVFDKPKADFQFVNINSAPPNVEVKFTNTSSNNTISYLWQFGDGETDTAANPTHLYNNINDFKTTLISFTADGCSDTITKTIETKFNHGLFVPDAFMPFSDKEKSVKYFLPVGLGLKEYHLSIYNTHGTLLYETTALDSEGRPSEYWDGKYKDEELPQDVYVWKIEATFNDGSIWQGNTYDGTAPKKIGSVTLLK
jgi:PKD repeat protein